MQCKNDLKELKRKIKVGSSTSNVTVSDEKSLSNSHHALKLQKDGYDSASKISPLRSLLSPSRINKVEKDFSDLPIESLSQGTRNFLIELAASNPSKTSSESGYALSTINSPFSRKNKKSQFVTDFIESKTVSECVDISIPNNDTVSTLTDSTVTTVKNDAGLSFLSSENTSATCSKDANSISNAKNVSILNDQVMSDLDCIQAKDVSLLNDQVASVSECAEADDKVLVSNDLINIADTKDVVNALDLIEQSSLHDKEMSSAEICSSLNQIFSDANVVFSTTLESNPEDSQAAGTGIDFETVTLQTVDSNIANFPNIEGNTINLADLYSGDNPEMCHQILLVQDESGNIETVLLLPQDAQVVESIPSDEAGTAESLLLLDNNGEIINNETETQAEQSVFFNVSTENILDQVQNVSIMNDIDNSKDVLILDSVNEHQLKADLENCKITEILSPHKNLVTDHDNSEMEQTNEQNVHTEEFVDQLEKSTLIDQTINSVNLPSSQKSQTSDHADKDKILPQNVCGTIQNEQEFLLKCSENSLNNAIDMQPVVTASVNVNSEEISNTVKSFDNREVILLRQFPNDVEKSLNEHDKKSDNSVVDSNIVTLNDNRNKFKINSVANISDSSILTSVDSSSTAKKRFSINGTNCLKSVQFNQHIQPSLNDSASVKTNDKSISTPLNGAVYHSQSNSSNLQKNQSYGDTSYARQFILPEILRKITCQKSKKTVAHKLNNRTAKKSASVSKENDDLYQIYQLLNSDPNSYREFIKNEENYTKAKKMLLKRGLEDDVADYILKRKKHSHPDSMFNNELTRPVALKTFIKPFTAAKKSAFDPRRKSKNTALKTCMSRGFLKNTALKSFSQNPISERSMQVESENNFLRSGLGPNFSSVQNQQNNHELSNSYFQPQICEIRIMPNEYVKRASDVLLKTSHIDRPSTPEENASEEETKILPECSSPMDELMLPKIHCTCTEREIPCLCYDNNLQKICEAEDTIDDKLVPCTNHVSQHYLHTPSSEIKHRAFCDIHLWRLRQHHCCPKCGIFCSQGDFFLCSFEHLERKENHLFHTSCFIIPSSGLPPSCPHCCQFSNFVPVNLFIKSATDEEQNEVPSNAQNITPEINGCDVFLNMKQDIAPEQSTDSDTYIPQKNVTQLMIRSLGKENFFRLRPTAKCLYNPIKTGDVQKVMQLIGNGVNPNHKFRTQGNNAPLHVAAHYGWTGILHILIQAGAYIDSVNDDLETPLIVAVEKKQLPIVRYLISAGAQIDVKDCNGMTSFHIASKNGFKEIAEFLYSTGNIDINLQDDGGWTALVWACEHKHVEFVRWLLEIGADPNVRDNEGNTVLHWAAYSGKCEIAELLLDKGCTLSYVNKRGDSALHIAAREDNYECIKLFINRGAVVDQKNKENKTPLMCCQDDSLSFNCLCQSISSGALKIGKLLLEKHVVFRDISRGAEAYPIQAINEVDDEEFIMEFRYVVKQCHRLGVNINSTVDSMQFCYCKDNCITRDCNCTVNSKCWYDANGCLTSEYDLQSSPIIFECNKTCHCPKTCINRVVQQGLRFPIQIFRTRYKGWGVRALQDIPKGAFVCEYVGELITGTEATQRNDDTYLFDLESQDSDYCLDGRYFGNVARFLNHSCEPNLIALKVFVEHQDMNFPRIAFFAYKNIQAFEELCFDYGLGFWIVKCKTILCVCNSQSCKYSKDTIDDTLWRFFMDTDSGEQLQSVDS